MLRPGTPWVIRKRTRWHQFFGTFLGSRLSTHLLDESGNETVIVVIDTNVWISALQSRAGCEGRSWECSMMQGNLL
jgi:hypothetical protein